MIVMKRFFILLMVLSVLSSCKSTKDTNSLGANVKAIDNKLNETWTLDLLNGKQVTTKDFTKELPKIEIKSSASTFSGFSGCNVVKGALFSKGKGQIQFLNVVTEQKKCAASNKEEEFMKLLKTTESYSIENNKLTLINMFGPTMVFKKGN